jgi:hypothetical protein
LATAIAALAFAAPAAAATATLTAAAVHARVKPACAVWILAALAALAVAPDAAADPAADSADTVFLDTIHSRGLGSAGGDSGLVSMGHAACVLLSNGYSKGQVTAATAPYAHGRLSDDAVLFIIDTAALAYCPQYR